MSSKAIADSTLEKCEQFQKLTGISDNRCKLNQLRKRRIIDRAERSKKGYWRVGNPKLLEYVLRNARVREDWRGHVSREVFYGIFYPTAAEILEEISRDRSLSEFMGEGGGAVSHGDVYCLDRGVVGEAPLPSSSLAVMSSLTLLASFS